MEPNLAEAPIVFLSYSHDSDEHKDWVVKLATELRNVGINVILDQWEIGPGDDVPKFMERSVSKSLRVIMVCTEEYVRKANDGKGGAGYEAMVVTGELVADLGTRKFIPIVRQSSDAKAIPVCLSGRFFVDFSADVLFEEKLEELARDIHQAPAIVKPALGSNPFTSPSEVVRQGEPAEELLGDDPVAVYKEALGYAQSGNFQAWSSLIHQQKKTAEESLKEWAEKNKQSLPQKDNELPDFLQPAVELYSGIFAVALAGVDSGDTRFQHQLSLIDWIRNPKGWERSGFSVWIHLPDLVLFCYQACLGAFTLNRMLPQLTYNLATTPISGQYHSPDKRSLFLNSSLIGWPESMAHHCTIAQGFITQYLQSQEWLHEIMGDADATLGSFGAYYSFLNILDFISAAKHDLIDSSDRLPRAPLFSVTLNDDCKILAHSLLEANGEYLCRLVEGNGLTDEQLAKLWPTWIILCHAWLSEVYSGRHHFSIPHDDFPEMIKKPSERLDTL